MSSMAVPSAYLPTAQQQQRLQPAGAGNPMLPQMPNTGDVDSQYLAEEAQLRAQVAQQYADILQQIGYTDQNGNFIPGSVSVGAGRQVEDLQRQSDLAAENVTNNAQQVGTLFSGLRARDTARAQQPYQTQIARLGVDTPIQISGLYNQAAGLLDQYTLQNNLYLAAMAQRRAAAIAQAGLTTGAVGGTPQQQQQSLQQAQEPPPPQPGPAPDQTTWPSDNPEANIDYALSPVGAEQVAQVIAHPASAGSSGAAQTLLAAAQGRNVPNYQARRNAY